MERFAGRYALLRRLGQGGMGSVHLALDLASGQECALKRLAPGAVALSADALAREFELLTRLRHPAVVSVFELGFAPDGSPFYTMEYVPGLPADRAVRPGDWRTLCSIAIRMADGLEALHAAAVVHGDLKPSNVLVVPGADAAGAPVGVRLVDFGLGALLGRDRAGHRGTPGYAAPEVVRGDPQSVASDLYGLGATLYALASGGRARAPATPRGGVGAAPTQAPAATPLEAAGLPAPLVRLILRLMAPAANERCANAREVRQELERIHPGARRPLADRLQAERVVGRERALARLERWMLSGAPAPRVMVVSGPAGMGKTALLGEIAARAVLQGRTVLRRSCVAGGPPGQTARELWRMLAAAARAGTGAGDASERALERLGVGGPGWGDADLGLLAEAAVAWGRRIGRGPAGPLLLLDDWEQLDRTSRTLVRRTALHPEAGDHQWIWAMAEPGDDERVLLDAGLAANVPLEPLDPSGVERLLAARLQAPPPRDLCELILRRSGGHPGIAVELLRTGAKSGALKESETGVTFERAALESTRSPGFEESLLLRLAALPAHARPAAEALATWRRPVSPDDLRLVAPGVSDDALERLHAAGLARRDEEGRFALCTAVLGERLLGSLDEERRHALHRAVLGHPRLSGAERFEHLRASGSPREALRAADAALASGADEDLMLAAAVEVRRDRD